MFCPKCGQKLSEGKTFCIKCGSEWSMDLSKNKHSNKKSIFSIIFVLFILILGTTLFLFINDKIKYSASEVKIKNNPLEDTEWEYSSGATIFGIGAKKSYTIAFTEEKYIINKTNKIGYKNFSLENVPLIDVGPQYETGIFTIEDKIITLIPDSGISILLAETDSKNILSFLEGLLSLSPDEQISKSPPVESQKYTGLLIGNTIRIGEKKFKGKKNGT